MRAIERGVDVGGAHVEAVDVVELAVPGFRHLPAATTSSRRHPACPGARDRRWRIAHHADAVRVGAEHRAFQEAGFRDPVAAGHLAVAIEREDAANTGVSSVPARAAGSR
jgi:hypothetical protein